MYSHLSPYSSHYQAPKMYTVTTLLLFVVLVEVLRRCCMVLITAFTGPLSKIPGPLLYKLTSLPANIHTLRGTHSNLFAELFEKYGDVVRVGKLPALRTY